MNLKQIEEKIGIAIGEASMCWSETPKGVFDSTNARRVADNLSNDIMKEITQLLEELRIKQKDYKYDEENEDSCFQTFETLGEAYIEGENYCARKINSKIDKILNK